MRSSVLALASVALVANAVAVSDVAQMKRNIVKRQSLTAAGTGDGTSRLLAPSRTNDPQP